jgi:hypothetical protein
VRREVRQIFDYARVDELLAYGDESKLLSIVMRLTNGTANPALVLAQIKAHKCAESVPEATDTDLQSAGQPVTPQQKSL